eukprot:gene7008-7222_t
MSTSSSPVTPVRAVNLRDIGEIDPRLKKGVLFRCSQIYTPDVLRELKIRTVVDLRGRVEKKKKGDKRSQGPPPLLRPEEVDALHARQADQPEDTEVTAAHPQADWRAGADPKGGVRPGVGSVTADFLGGAEATPDLEGNDIAVKTLRRQDSTASLSSADELPASEAPSNNGNGNLVVRKAQGHEELAAGLAEDVETPLTENFNVIPGKEFGYAMLRMPWRIWRGALTNLVTGRDPRVPFVNAFADEQLLGFTRYYIIILEHAKKNIADYVQSEIQLRQYREGLGLPDPTGATGAVIPLNEVIIASTAETLRALLAYMDKTYITVDNYLSSCGLSQEEIDAIRSNLLKEGMAARAAAPAGPAQGH